MQWLPELLPSRSASPCLWLCVEVFPHSDCWTLLHFELTFVGWRIGIWFPSWASRHLVSLATYEKSPFSPMLFFNQRFYQRYPLSRIRWPYQSIGLPESFCDSTVLFLFPWFYIITWDHVWVIKTLLNNKEFVQKEWAERWDWNSRWNPDWEEPSKTMKSEFCPWAYGAGCFRLGFWKNKQIIERKRFWENHSQRSKTIEKIRRVSESHPHLLFCSITPEMSGQRMMERVAESISHHRASTREILRSWSSVLNAQNCTNNINRGRDGVII